MRIDHFPCAVIGAGVVGISVARELARRGLEVLVLESADCIGSETSSRNSEVIHAGIYYPPGSLKARLCVEGKQRLYDYCEQRGIPHQRCGKLIVACDDGQLDSLRQIDVQACANGVTDLVWLNQAQVRELEPEVRASHALYSPSTGIIDSHQLMLSLQGEAEAAGAVFVLRAPVLAGQIGPDGIDLHIGGEEGCILRVRYLVNAAGLAAPAVASSLRGFPAAQVPRAYFAKGNYFSVSGKSPFRHLVYPVPEPGGLGIHVTRDLAGQVRFGPDVEWADRPDYQMDPTRGELFYAAIRRYWPGLPDGALTPA